ncbi:hypothetical protein PRK78_000127 [Emydomyces testavorans]|uniref:DOC domain-containing protein n=1 Tax=Emydomyces testavorans TaxID=2070801 RepID=A0AAF0DAL9_9EURO|nr:hypothetical protein PRK78_000127 [Emydomyces testavorans]
MPRHIPQRPAFPSEDGAFSSTARTNVPQLVPPRTTNTTTTAPTAAVTGGAHYNRRRRVAVGPSGQAFVAHGAPGAGNANLQDVEEGFEGLDDDEEDFDEGDEDEDSDLEDEEDDDEEGENEEDEGADEDEDYEMQDDPRNTSAPIPPNFREISSLASWTVSTHKPGCGIAALRNPSPSQFWQSDGPQPHTLTLHFFKRVSVVRIRVYLDFELDESYTPTKMVFLAGMGGNDLVEFAAWQGESPCGWVDIPLDGVGGSHEGRVRKKRRGIKGDKQTPNGQESGHHEERFSWGSSTNDDDERNSDYHHSDSEDDDGVFDNNDEDPTAGNVLKAMVIQVRICENHQNGKDTHVRGFQVYARDDKYYFRTRSDSTRKSLRTSGGPRKDVGDMHTAEGETDNGLENGLARIDESDWFLRPEIR